jgi:DNA-binding CsgD family transcriptional regulator
MSVAISSLIVLNALMFGVLGIRAFVLGRRAESPYLRALAWMVSGACAAFVLGAAQRLALQAVTAGWLPDVGLVRLTNQWQLVQSLAAFSIAVAGLWTLSRTWGPIRLSELVASTLAGRLPDVDLEKCDLTAREWEVIDVIGQGRLSDREISEALFIAPTTAATHIKRILRKTGLASRRDIMLLFLAKGQ